LIGTKNRSNINGPLPHGSGRVGRTQKDRGVVDETVYTTQYFTMGNTSVVGEERWELTLVYGLQTVE